MKMEWKLSVFPEERWKRRGNVKNEDRNLQNESENGIFMRKRKQKWNGVFRWNMHGNGTFRFREYEISVFTIDLWLLCSPITKENTMTQLVEWI